MRKRRVPTEEIGLFLGHLPDGAVATTAIYAPYEPGFLGSAIEVIEAVFDDLRKQMRPGLLSPPSADGAAQLRLRSSGRGISEEKREHVRKLILGGVAHQQIVKATGVSSGTVSVIRRDIKAQMPLMRATACVTVALLNAKGRLSEVQKGQEKIGGPGRSRTCDNTVMSGRKKPGESQQTSVFRCESLNLTANDSSAASEPTASIRVPSEISSFSAQQLESSSQRRSLGRSG
jgi:hypothetical protein